ncbi:MAG: hypothetical protein Q7J13_14935 [Brevundimonas sp.]|uniref:hypothetical protein n=1 Tax=Brevundimonas sp. TaxID=1871086 RepID=UPI00271B2699|nr:hypothetical protein [Brevundimonas sp.]MDO9589209.1 hypothetical protein [Brevundimonas sp.]
MRDKADKPAARRRRIGGQDIVSYGLIVGAVVLGWQIAIQPLTQRAPVEVAVRLAPGSPLVLRRAAESELAAGRIDNAAALSRDALGRSPFDVRALRVLGLTEARAGREDEADDILTLAGNWSLRDDPAHAWLVERRLRRGDYASSFAHADTLVRRRQDIQPQVFRLFTVAGTEDPQRSLPVIASLLAARPPWRAAYLNSLSQTPQELQLAASLAILLEAGRAPLTSGELQGLYWALLGKGQVQALNTVRGRLNRPPPGVAVTNGGFADAAAPEPFQWRLLQKAGIVAEVVADDLRPSNPALRVDYDGYATGTVAEQLTSLPPGAYRFTAEVRTETGDPAARLAWTLSCATGEGVIPPLAAGAPNAAPNAWAPLAGRFQVPNTCPVQWLRLETRADDRRAPTVVWFDRIAISPAG